MKEPITSATFNLTQQCNLRCGYCFTHGKTARKGSLSVGKKCLDFLIRGINDTDPLSFRGRERKIDFGFWGGEPLLEFKLLKKLVHYAEGLKCGFPIRFGLTTNGTLLTDEILSYAKDHDIRIVISFDGTQETHDRHRRFIDGGGSHAAVSRGIEKALRYFPGQMVRLSPYAERADFFCADIKHIIDLGIENIMFSPVYESAWSEERWNVFQSQAEKVVELLLALKSKEKMVHIEHYKSYCKTDSSKWPCGAGRSYIGFDIDGAIYPCHRFNKFNDHRKWSEKEYCLGHVDVGLSNRFFLYQFENFKPKSCGECEFDKTTPCHGGCYAINFDLTGRIQTAPPALCNYTRIQSIISQKFLAGQGPRGFTEVRPHKHHCPSPEAVWNVLCQFDKQIGKIESLISRKNGA